jgi:hypothetical protein
VSDPSGIIPTPLAFLLLYAWDAGAQQYRDASGRFVPRPTIRQTIDDTIAATERDMGALAAELRTGDITGDEWLAEMQARVKDVHLYNAAAAKGGWAQLTEDDLAVVGREVRRQYTYLNRFADQIDHGLVLDGRFLARVELYAEAGRGTFEAITGDMMAARGKTEEHNVLHPAEHCQGCLDETDRGWVPIGELVPIGARDCLGRCKCTMAYR